jgi:hypothetical protein
LDDAKGWQGWQDLAHLARRFLEFGERDQDAATSEAGKALTVLAELYRRGDTASMARMTAVGRRAVRRDLDSGNLGATGTLMRVGDRKDIVENLRKHAAGLLAHSPKGQTNKRRRWRADIAIGQAMIISSAWPGAPGTAICRGAIADALQKLDDEEKLDDGDGESIVRTALRAVGPSLKLTPKQMTNIFDYRKRGAVSRASRHKKKVRQA